MVDQQEVLEDLPLVVDLDGTLILSDLLYESILKLAITNPQKIIALPGYLLAGKAELKRYVANQVTLNVATLPYNELLLEWLHLQKLNGRRLILCTASDQLYADAVAKHLGIFDHVLGSNGTNNLVGEDKALALGELLKGKPYVYAGNSKIDLYVWAKSAAAVVVNADKNTEAKVAKTYKIEKKISSHTDTGVAEFLRTLRAHQWVKNIMIFFPLIASHDLGNYQSWNTLAFAFLSFCSCASAVYIANDLFDLESDRLHPRKKARVFASGKVSIGTGMFLIPVLLFISLYLSLYVSAAFVNILILYFALTCLYSIYLKRIALLDCITLSILYTLRIIAGAAAIGNILSFWLASFSIFIFLSLAFVKRYAEVHDLLLTKNTHSEKLIGRDYTSKDAPLILTMGVTAGYSAVIVMALYLNSDEIRLLYSNISAVWIAILVLVFWVSWMWFQANRGNMHDDPIIFALQDKISLLAGISFVVLMLVGALGLPW